MATAKKATAKKPTKKVNTPVVVAGDISTEFGTFRIDSAGTIHQTVYPKSVDAIADMTAEQVESLIRSQA